MADSNGRRILCRHAPMGQAAATGGNSGTDQNRDTSHGGFGGRSGTTADPGNKGAESK